VAGFALRQNRPEAHLAVDGGGGGGGGGDDDDDDDDDYEYDLPEYKISHSRRL
jgi:hypothetical protein